MNLKQNFTNKINTALVQVHNAEKIKYFVHFSLFSLFRSVNHLVKIQKMFWVEKAGKVIFWFQCVWRGGNKLWENDKCEKQVSQWE